MQRHVPLTRDGYPRVVITGTGVVSPAGVGVEALWRLIVAAESGETLLPQMERFGMNTHIFGPVREFNPLALGLEQEVVARNDRYALFALVAADEAVGQAKLDVDAVNGERAGVNIGTAVGATGAMEQGFLQLSDQGQEPIRYERSPGEVYQYASPGTATLEVASRYGFMGPSATTSTGCTSGIDSVGYAWSALRNGEADLFIAGASDAPLVPIAICAFDSIRAVTRKPREMVGRASSPFSSERDGFVLAEGAGIVVIETLEHALGRGATVLAEITGYGSTSNAFHMTGMPSEGEDLARAIDVALQLAGLRPSQIHYLNAHGSSTPQNDRGETAAYYRSFGQRANGIPVSSLKSQLGHSLGAASSIEIISSVLAIHYNFLPPTINYGVPDPDCSLFDYVPNRGRSHPIDTVITDASGFCGLHSAMVIQGFHE
jgi:3-oxoacyl-(acyl-carrier-protein) synthase